MVQPTISEARSAGTVAASFMKSLLWVAVFAAVAAGVMSIAAIIFLDFAYGNPHRTQEDAIWMIKYHAPIDCLIAGIGTLVVFTIPQYFQAASIALLLKRFGSRGWHGIAIVVPTAAVVTWYCYDYLTPSNFNLGINIVEMYQHGLTLDRYLATLGIQVLVTSFSLVRWRFQVSDNRRATALLMLAMSVASIAFGGLAGYDSALEQYQFRPMSDYGGG